MKPFTGSKYNTILNRLIYSLCICIILFVWFNHIPFDNPKGKSDVRAENDSKVFTSKQLSPKLCVPGILPVVMSLELLNEPQLAGDVAEFTFSITALTKFDHISAYFITPEGATRVSGENWAGMLGLNESNQLQAEITVNTEDAITLLAVVEVSKDDSTFIFKKAYHLDLGEKEYADIEALAISGFAGADSLNLIIPKL